MRRSIARRVCHAAVPASATKRAVSCATQSRRVEHTEVRRNDDVGHGEERVAWRQRLRVGDVEARGEEASFAERVHERLRVDHGPASDVDEHSGTLHATQFGGADKAARVRLEWYDDDDKVALGEELVLGAIRSAQRLLLRLGETRAIVVEKSHVKGECALCNLLSCARGRPRL